MQKTEQPLAYTVDELAARLKVGRDGIYKAIRDGRLKAKKFGTRTLITSEAADAFLNNLPSLELS